jgi:hypothetical protein
MKIAIHQPNYLPWCGYFAKISKCDAFIFLDDAQMPRGRSYVSRTKIRSNAGSQWLTAPTIVHDDPTIADVSLAEEIWAKRHLATLRHTYSKAPHGGDVMAILEPIYQTAGANLSQVNRRLISAILDYLDLERGTYLSSSFGIQGTSDDRLIELIHAVGGTHYVSGRGGMNYQDPGKFKAAGIELEVCEYSPIPYDAPRYPFVPGLSIVDALFIQGKAARDLLRYKA